MCECTVVFLGKCDLGFEGLTFYSRGSFFFFLSVEGGDSGRRGPGVGPPAPGLPTASPTYINPISLIGKTKHLNFFGLNVG